MFCVSLKLPMSIFWLESDLMNGMSQRSLPSCSQWEISLASLKHCVVCLLGLTGLKKLGDKHTHTHAHTHTHSHSLSLPHTHTCIHTRAPSPQRRPLSSSPGGNDDSHYLLKARWPRCPYSAALLSYQTALLYWCSIISFPLSFGVHQGVVVL